MIGKIGTGTVFPLLGQSIARYEVRNALPFYDARKWENGTCPHFPNPTSLAQRGEIGSVNLNVGIVEGP